MLGRDLDSLDLHPTAQRRPPKLTSRNGMERNVPMSKSADEERHPSMSSRGVETRRSHPYPLARVWIGFVTVLIILVGCSEYGAEGSGTDESPQASADEAISSLCLHLQGFVAAADRGFPSPTTALAVDAQVLREAGEDGLAAEVEDLEARLAGQGIELAVFLRDDIADADRRAIGERLRTTPRIEQVAFESKHEAFKRFREMFKDSPILLENIDEEVLPESWRAIAREGDVSDLAKDLRKMSGVRSVGLEPAGFFEAASDFLRRHRSLCPGLGFEPPWSP
jgi:hypothetical protein